MNPDMSPNMSPGHPAISAIVPARNEELNIEAAVRSLAAQAEIGEIIVVNDESSDSTAERLASLVLEISRLRIIEAGNLPPGWVGKSHAAWLGAAQARGDWLLFTDADVIHLPGSAARALADAKRTGAALVSYSPDQELRTWGERMLIPFVFIRLASRFSYQAVSNPRLPAAAANGQYLMIRREAYDAVGGHAGVRGQVIEDVVLARLLKKSGWRLYFARGAGIARTRMYRNFAELWQGWTKNLYPLLGGSVRGVISELLRAIPWLPLILLCGGAFDRRLALFGLLLLVLWHARYGLQLRRYHYPLASILYYVPAALLYLPVVCRSAAAHRGGAVQWRGRVYAVHHRDPVES
jgi:glycosyltransferase involved in cell wall biosynthesis